MAISLLDAAIIANGFDSVTQIEGNIRTVPYMGYGSYVTYNSDGSTTIDNKALNSGAGVADATTEVTSADDSTRTCR